MDYKALKNILEEQINNMVVDEKALKEKIIKTITDSENINNLPLYKDFEKVLTKEEMVYFKNEFLLESYIEEIYKTVRIKIKDGTTICLQRHFTFPSCINAEDIHNHKDFYYIEETGIYICLDCGTRQKAYNYLTTREIVQSPYEEHIVSIPHYTLIPLNWNEEKINERLKIKKERRLRWIKLKKSGSSFF